MDYSKSFSNRAKSYISAITLYPDVLKEEFEVAVHMCNLQENETLLTIPSSCEKIESYLPDISINYIAFETSKELAEITNTPFCTFQTIPLENSSVNKILSLATLHHCNEEERFNFYKESHRILHPGGKLIIGDVLKGSEQDSWLNIFVDTHNPYGHKGIFWSEDDKELIEKAGFTVTTSIEEYTWNFTDFTAMYDFVRRLFCIHTSDEELVKGLRMHLGVTTKPVFSWKLLYLVATKKCLQLSP